MQNNTRKANSDCLSVRHFTGVNNCNCSRSFENIFFTLDASCCERCSPPAVGFLLNSKTETFIADDHRKSLKQCVVGYGGRDNMPINPTDPQCNTADCV